MSHILKCHDIFLRDIVRAHDCYLYDDRNKRYVDFESGLWCTALGHNHPRITQAIQTQLEQVMHLNNRYLNVITEEAALKLLETVAMPNGKCVFLSSGSEAVELGAQIARLMTGKPLLLTLSDSYLAAYGSAGKKDSKEWVTLDWSECLTCNHPEDCDEDCWLLKAIPFDDIGGFVFEPGSTSGLVKFPPKPLIDHLAKIVRHHQGLLIVNEVTTGVGRTGKWFGFQHYAFRPDIIAVGKGIGNGYPVSAVTMTRDIADMLEKREFHYSQSHQNDPLGCAVAKEVIAVMEEEALVERSKRIGAQFLSELNLLRERHGIIKEIRGRGLMIGIEFERGHSHLSAASVHRKLLERGILVGLQPYGHVIRFYPALTIGESDIAYLVENLTQVLEDAR